MSDPVMTIPGTSRPIDLAAARRVAAGHVDAGTLPCAVFGIVGLDGAPAIGAVSGPRLRVTPESVLFMASITKAIVATAVMQYVDEGRLDLDAPIARYVPEFSGAGREAVTARHVLTHTSGLSDGATNALPSERPGYQRALREVLKLVPEFEPGTRFSYATAPWLLLSETMSRLSRMPFPSALGIRLTRPLGMDDTLFDVRTVRGRVAAVHGLELRNRLVEEVVLRFLARATHPGGGMFGTVGDLLRLGRALLASGREDGLGPRVLSGPTFREMASLQTAHLHQVGPDGQERQIRFGLGWAKPRPGLPGWEEAIMHGGAAGGRIWISPARGYAFAFLSSLWDAPDEPAFEVLAAVDDAWAEADRQA
jgi:CubicO group peptidase (beta-lactamase class C family)